MEPIAGSDAVQPPPDSVPDPVLQEIFDSASVEQPTTQVITDAQKIQNHKKNRRKERIILNRLCQNLHLMVKW